MENAKSVQHASRLTFHVVKGFHAGAQVDIEPPSCKVGSDPACDIVLLDPDVAPQHFVLSLSSSGKITMEIVAPVLINHEAPPSETPLRLKGDELLTIGGAQVQLSVSQDAPAPPESKSPFFPGALEKPHGLASSGISRLLRLGPANVLAFIVCLAILASAVASYFCVSANVCKLPARIANIGLFGGTHKPLVKPDAMAVVGDIKQRFPGLTLVKDSQSDKTPALSGFVHSRQELNMLEQLVNEKKQASLFENHSIVVLDDLLLTLGQLGAMNLSLQPSQGGRHMTIGFQWEERGARSNSESVADLQRRLPANVRLALPQETKSSLDGNPETSRAPGAPPLVPMSAAPSSPAEPRLLKKPSDEMDLCARYLYPKLASIGGSPPSLRLSDGRYIYLGAEIPECGTLVLLEPSLLTFRNRTGKVVLKWQATSGN